LPFTIRPRESLRDIVAVSSFLRELLAYEAADIG
jgi:hypothetical protein